MTSLRKRLQARAPRVHAPACVEPAHWALAAGSGEHSGMSDGGVSRARTRRRQRAQAHSQGRRSAPGRIPSSRSQAGRVPLPGFLLCALGIIRRWRCCELLQRGQHPASFLFLVFLPPAKFLLHRLREWFCHRTLVRLTLVPGDDHLLVQRLLVPAYFLRRSHSHSLEPL